VVVDPIPSYIFRRYAEVKSMLSRQIDFLRRIRSPPFTSLTEGEALSSNQVGISSLMDTWILLRHIESNGERNRGIWVLKSRGMPHSNQIREFVFTDHGIELVDVYLGSAGVLTGTARVAQEAQEKAEALLRRQDLERKHRALAHRKKALEAKIAALRAEFETEKEELEKDIIEQNSTRGARTDRAAMAKRRKADASSNNRPNGQRGVTMPAANLTKIPNHRMMLGCCGSMWQAKRRNRSRLCESKENLADIWKINTASS
jgi:circadian clock protein KaiC